MRLVNGTRALHFCLKSSEILSVCDDSAALTVACEHGYVWLTADGDGRDILLKSGESASFPAGRHLVAQALEGSTLRVGTRKREAA